VLQVLREGAGVVSVVLAASRIPSPLGPVAALTGSRLLLRAASRDEHLLAGGASGGFDRTAPAGRGELDGTPLQVAMARRASEPPAERTLPLQPIPGLVAVSARPATLATALGEHAVHRLDSAGPAAPQPGRVLIGTPDEWQTRWGTLRQLAGNQPVLFDGCSPAEVRSLLGRQELPPPCSGTPRWLFRPGEPAVRVRAASGG
jgi:S-DNA-T family DNA segregation ATPase FtsK/SpoIIIE